MNDLIFCVQRQLKYTNLLLQRIESAETVLQQNIARIQARQLSKDFADNLIDEQRKHEEKLFKELTEKEQKDANNKETSNAKKKGIKKEGCH